MPNLTIQMPDSIDVAGILGFPPTVDINTVMVSEALGEIILGVLNSALRLPETRTAYLEQAGEIGMAAIVADPD